jgi:hypothetical protein
MTIRRNVGSRLSPRYFQPRVWFRATFSRSRLDASGAVADSQLFDHERNLRTWNSNTLERYPAVQSLGAARRVEKGVEKGAVSTDEAAQGKRQRRLNCLLFEEGYPSAAPGRKATRLILRPSGYG